MKNLVLIAMIVCLPLVGCSEHKWDNQQKKLHQYGCYVYLSKYKNVCIDLLLPPIEVSKKTSFRVLIKGSSEKEIKEVTSKTLEVVLWMPSMGHGSAPTTVAKETPTTYLVTDVNFIMAGEWQVIFRIKDGTEVLDEGIFNIEL